jgi:hypothetical protein
VILVAAVDHPPGRRQGRICGVSRRVARDGLKVMFLRSGFARRSSPSLRGSSWPEHAHKKHPMRAIVQDRYGEVDIQRLKHHRGASGSQTRWIWPESKTSST